jgi:hypothetical protein
VGGINFGRVEIQNLSFSDISYQQDISTITVIESQNALRISLSKIKVVGEFLYSINSPLFKDVGEGFIQITDIYIDCVLLPFVDENTGELRINVTRFSIDYH